AQNLLDGLERYALRIIGDGFLLGQAGPRQAQAQVGQCRVRKTHLEWADGNIVTDRLLGGGTHGFAPFRMTEETHEGCGGDCRCQIPVRPQSIGCWIRACVQHARPGGTTSDMEGRCYSAKDSETYV